MKEIKDDTSKRKDIKCSWNEIICIAKISILSKAIYRFNCNTYQNTKGTFFFLYRTRPDNSKSCMKKNKRPKMDKAILRENKARGIISNITNSIYWLRNRQNRDNGTE